jgi:hypothetical protein
LSLELSIATLFRLGRQAVVDRLEEADTTTLFVSSVFITSSWNLLLRRCLI